MARQQPARCGGSIRSPHGRSADLQVSTDDSDLKVGVTSKEFHGGADV